MVSCGKGWLVPVLLFCWQVFCCCCWPSKWKSPGRETEDPPWTWDEARGVRPESLFRNPELRKTKRLKLVRNEWDTSRTPSPERLIFHWLDSFNTMLEIKSITLHYPPLQTAWPFWSSKANNTPNYHTSFNKSDLRHALILLGIVVCWCCCSCGRPLLMVNGRKGQKCLWHVIWRRR